MSDTEAAKEKLIEKMATAMQLPAGETAMTEGVSISEFLAVRALDAIWGEVMPWYPEAAVKLEVVLVDATTSERLPDGTSNTLYRLADKEPK